MVAGKTHCLSIVMLLILLNVILQVKCGGINRISAATGIREKRGAAYAGAHPGSGSGGYGVGGVGIPGLNSAIQYSAYNKLLNSGHQGSSSGYGSGHGRKLTVDQAIGMFGHHTLNRPYPYTGGHESSGGSGHGGGGGGGGHSGGGGGGSGGYGR